MVRIKVFSNSGEVGTLNSYILITGSTFNVNSNIVVCLNAILEFGDRPHTAWLDKAMRYWSSMSRVAIVNSDHSFRVCIVLFLISRIGLSSSVQQGDLILILAVRGGIATIVLLYCIVSRICLSHSYWNFEV